MNCRIYHGCLTLPIAFCICLQLSYADTHPMFTPVHFPNFFRVVPSENAFNHPRLKMMQHFNWTRVGTLYQNEPRYSLVSNPSMISLTISIAIKIRLILILIPVLPTILKLPTRVNELFMIIRPLKPSWNSKWGYFHRIAAAKRDHYCLVRRKRDGRDKINSRLV